jgi:hypothetical protein
MSELARIGKKSLVSVLLTYFYVVFLMVLFTPHRKPKSSPPVMFRDRKGKGG